MAETRFGHGAASDNGPPRGGGDGGARTAVWTRVAMALAATGAGVGAFCARALTAAERGQFVAIVARSAALGHGPLKVAAGVATWDVLTLAVVAAFALWPPGRILAALSLGLRAAAAGWSGGLLMAGFGVHGILVAVLLVWLPALTLIGIGTVLLDRTLVVRPGRDLGAQKGASWVRFALGLLASVPVVAWQACLARPLGSWLG